MVMGTIQPSGVLAMSVCFIQCSKYNTRQVCTPRGHGTVCLRVSAPRLGVLRFSNLLFANSRAGLCLWK